MLRQALRRASQPKKKNMKIKSLLLVAAVFAATANTAPAQTYFQVARGGTENILAATNHVYSTYISTPGVRLIGIEERFVMQSAGTDRVILHVDGSITGSSFINDSLGTYTNAATGTTAQTNVVMVDTTGYVMVRLRIVNESATVAVTNIWLAASAKKTISTATLAGISESAVTNSDFTASTVVVSDGNKAMASSTTTATELGYIHGLTSALQTQLNTKAAATNGSIVTPTIANPAISGQTNSDLTASLPVFTDANKALATPSIAAARSSLGVAASLNGYYTNPIIIGAMNFTTTNTAPASFGTNVINTNIVAWWNVTNGAAVYKIPLYQ